MAARGISSVKSRNPRNFMAILSSAACEWFLIFMLFFDAALSYLLTKFANYCELQIPCLLCSRFEHVFWENKHHYYWSLLCCNHREEISSSVYCHTHDKVADVHAMCPDCLNSFARLSKSNSESSRLLAEESGFKNLLPNKPSGPRNCSCCNRLLKAKSNAQRPLQLTPIATSRANVRPPLPRVPGRSRFSRRDSLKRLRDKISGQQGTPRLGGKAGVDTLSHVGYTELKITSDSESEFPFSDDDDVAFASSLHESNDSRTGSDIQEDLQKVPKVVSGSSSPGDQNQQSFESLPSVFDQPVELQPSETSLESNVHENHGFQEISWTQPNEKPITSRSPEHISLDDAVQNPVLAAAVPQPSNLFILSELLSLSSVLSSSTVAKTPEKSDIAETKEKGSVSIADASSISMLNHMNSMIAPTDTNIERTESGVAEPLRTNDSGEAEEVLYSPKISSSRFPSNHDGLQKNDALGPDTVDMLQLAAALERHDSGHESVDGINVKEIEGEPVLDRLTRQVEYDRRCMTALFRELEEERGASAIATNEAMAMITRLQEEKASLHMEALQYLRMMEEQAEYDMEALEKANDLLAEREKHIQDLEAELEIYRDNVLDEPLMDDPREGMSNESVDSKMTDNSPTGNVQNRPTATDDWESGNISKDIHKHEKLSIPEIDFEDEKLYISQCLEKLEKKLHQIPRNEAPVNLANGHYSDESIKGYDPREELDNDVQINHGENGLMQKHHLDYEESNCLDADGGGSKLGSFTDDINDLKNRLQALETNHDILEHALKSLHNGNDGLEFIREIAYQLQELQKIEFKKKTV